MLLSLPLLVEGDAEGGLPPEGPPPGQGGIDPGWLCCQSAANGQPPAPEASE